MLTLEESGASDWTVECTELSEKESGLSSEVLLVVHSVQQRMEHRAGLLLTCNSNAAEIDLTSLSAAELL